MLLRCGRRRRWRNAHISPPRILSEAQPLFPIFQFRFGISDVAVNERGKECSPCIASARVRFIPTLRVYSVSRARIVLSSLHD